MQVRDLLQPATILNDRHTLTDALSSIEQHSRVRALQEWLGTHRARRYRRLPGQPAHDRSAREAGGADCAGRGSPPRFRAPGSPIAVEEFCEIIGCLDPQQLPVAAAMASSDAGNARLLLHVLEPVAHYLGNALFALAASMDGLDDSMLAPDVLTCRAALRHASSVLQKLRAVCSGAIEGAPSRVDVARIITGMLGVAGGCGAGRAGITRPAGTFATHDGL